MLLPTQILFLKEQCNLHRVTPGARQPAQKIVSRWTLCQFDLQTPRDIQCSLAGAWLPTGSCTVCSLGHCHRVFPGSCHPYMQVTMVQFTVCCRRQVCNLHRVTFGVRRPVQKAVCKWTIQFGLPMSRKIQSSLAGAWLPTALFMSCYVRHAKESRAGTSSDTSVHFCFQNIYG